MRDDAYLIVFNLLFNDNRLKIERVVPYSYISMLAIIPLYVLCIIAITNPNNSFPHRISR